MERTGRKLDIAFASIGATGHVYSSLGIVRRLVEWGHRVHYLAPESHAAAVRAAGAESHDYPTQILAGGPPRRLDGFAMGHIPKRVAEEVPTAYPALRETLARLHPDVLVYDAFTFAARFAGESLGLPMVRKNGSFALSEDFDYYRDTEAGRLRGTMMTAESIADFDSMMRPWFARHRLRSRGFHELMLEPEELEVVLMSRAFHPHSERYPESVVFVGPAHLRESRPPVPLPALPSGGNRPIVLVSLGTVFTFQPVFFYACLEAFAWLDADVVLVVGRTFPAGFWVDVPPNIVITEFVPQLELLQAAQLFVTHAGTGSVMESLDCGVPMVCVPQFPEQLACAERVAELGAGLVVDREDVSIASLRAAAERVLGDPGFRRRAEQLGRAGREDGGADRAAERIVGFTRRRVT